MKLRSIAVLIAIVGLPALAIAAEMHMSGADSEVGKAFMTANDKMMKAMAIAPTADADRNFVVMMIPHHEGAIEMAKIELQFGKDPQLRQLAEAVIVAQEKEIAEMKVWLAGHVH